VSKGTDFFYYLQAIRRLFFQKK